MVNIKDKYYKRRSDLYSRCCFLPFKAKFKDEEERRLHVSKSFIAFAVSLLLQDIVQPIKYPTTLKGDRKKRTYINPFQEAVQDDDKRTEILEKVIKKILVMKSVSENPSSQEMSNQTHPKKPDWSNAVDIENLIKDGFDKIWVDDIFESLRVFGTNACTAKTFQEFREVINGKNSTLDIFFLHNMQNQ